MQRVQLHSKLGTLLRKQQLLIVRRDHHQDVAAILNEHSEHQDLMHHLVNRCPKTESHAHFCGAHLYHDALLADVPPNLTG
jgi:hypothetical protein